MQKTVMVRVRVTEREFESIKHQMRVRGFSTVSAYVRSFALERDFWIEKKVQETHHLVQEILQIIEKK